LAHRRRNGKSNQSTERNSLSVIFLKGRDEPIKFVLCRPPVTFGSFSHETKPSERDASRRFLSEQIFRGQLQRARGSF